MIIRKVLLSVCACVVGLAAVGEAPCSRGGPPVRGAREAIDAEFDRCELKAMSVGLSRGGRQLFSYVRESQTVVTNDVAWSADGQTHYAKAAQARKPFDADTPLETASVTKTVTAMLVLQLVSEGRLALDDKMAKYIPEFPDPEVTVVNMLTHTSGWRNARNSGFDPKARKEEKVKDFYARMFRELPREREFRYFSSGYDVLVDLIERITGETDIDSYSQRRLFVPLGMTHTSMTPQTGQVGMKTTVGDMLILGNEILAVNRTGRPGKALDPETVRLALTPVLDPKFCRTPAFFVNNGRGLGFCQDFIAANSPKAVGHGGSSGCYFMVDPGLDVVGVILSRSPQAKIHTLPNGYKNVFRVMFDAAGIRPARDGKVPTVMNIVNFVRGNEPRYPDIDLVLPLREEIRLNTAKHLPNTILMQYDALLRPDLVAAAKTAEPGKTEYGVWLEWCRQLVEKCGMTWRGRPGWDWEWFVNPGLPMGYSPAEREKLCDEVFRLFKETFGTYPKSVGGWLLDAPTMDYLTRRYGADAFCICREQDATDAYGLRGGYANGAYYPSRKNALSAAVDMKNAIPTPVFRMLTPDPIYNYGAGWNEHGQIKSPIPEACTLEPGCGTGQRRDIVDWFFRIYTGSALLGLSYMQTGQENCFGWKEISKGLPYQIEVIADLQAKGKIEVLTLGETGRRFKAKHRENIPQTLVALEDWSGQGYKCVCYSSKRYRMNLFFDGKSLYFRDIHKFCDDHCEAYLTAGTRKWFASYVTPPVVDGYLLAKDGYDGTAAFGGTFVGFDAKADGDRTLVVTALRPDGTKLVIAFREDAIEIDFGLTSEDAFRTAALRFRGGGAFFDTLDFPPGKIAMSFEGTAYEVGYFGDLKPSPKGWTLHPIRGKARLDFGSDDKKRR